MLCFSFSWLDKFLSPVIILFMFRLSIFLVPLFSFVVYSYGFVKYFLKFFFHFLLPLRFPFSCCLQYFFSFFLQSPTNHGPKEKKHTHTNTHTNTHTHTHTHTHVVMMALCLCLLYVCLVFALFVFPIFCYYFLFVLWPRVINKYTHAHTRMHTHAHPHKHTRTPTHTHTYTHTHIHTRAHKSTHNSRTKQTRTHNQFFLSFPNLFCTWTCTRSDGTRFWKLTTNKKKKKVHSKFATPPTIRTTVGIEIFWRPELSDCRDQANSQVHEALDGKDVLHGGPLFFQKFSVLFEEERKILKKVFWNNARKNGRMGSVCACDGVWWCACVCVCVCVCVKMITMVKQLNFDKEVTLITDECAHTNKQTEKSDQDTNKTSWQISSHSLHRTKLQDLSLREMTLTHQHVNHRSAARVVGVWEVVDFAQRVHVVWMKKRRWYGYEPNISNTANLSEKN